MAASTKVDINTLTLLDAAGKDISKEQRSDLFKSKRVALFFTAGWCPMCTGFEPSLQAYADQAKGDGSPIELIMVSSDRNPIDALKRANDLGLVQVAYEDTAALKREFKVWAGSESFVFGPMRRSGVPALVVLSKDGEEIKFIDAERRGAAALKKWLPDEGVWP